jgi:Family of unknown function (DUF6516)
MMPDLRTYERFVYALPKHYPIIQQSTLVVIPHGAAFAELTGLLLFDHDITLHLWEDLDFDERVINGYSYSVVRGVERLYWYDPQPHPHIPELALNHPHHKHVPPDIKHNRIIAPGLSFTQPNLPFLIAEIEQTLLT